MAESWLPYGTQWIDDEDIHAVSEALRGAWLTTGPSVAAFEAGLCRATGAASAVAVSSGTAALHCAYAATGIGPGDEVIVPALTFSATANAAIYLGADVRFADIDLDSLTIDVDSAKSLLTSRTKVIVAVDYAGHVADYDRLASLAETAGSQLVADACHSIGGSYKGRRVGTLADLTSFSFHPVKTVTTGEGGAVLTSDTEMAEAARTFRNHGMRWGTIEALEETAEWAYDLEQLGNNYRITDFQCALGLSQLARLTKFVARRREIAAAYRQVLAAVDGVTLPPQQNWCAHGYHLFPIRVPASRRKHVFDGLRQRGIGAQVHYIPVNALAFYRRRGHDPRDTPRALQTYRQEISLPMFPRMTDDDVERVARALGELI